MVLNENRAQHEPPHQGNEHNGHGDHKEHGHDHAVTVLVNEQPVKLRGKSATGLEIKKAAIRAGVAIQENFVLQEDLPNGTSRIVGDHDNVHLREHLRFTAIAPDDNS